MATLTMEEVEKRYINAIVRKCGGNITRAAKALNLNRRTLQKKRCQWRRCGNYSRLQSHESH